MTFFLLITILSMYTSHDVVDLEAEHTKGHPLIGGSDVFEAEGHHFVTISALGVMKAVFSMSSSAMEI